MPLPAPGTAAGDGRGGAGGIEEKAAAPLAAPPDPFGGDDPFAAIGAGEGFTPGGEPPLPSRAAAPSRPAAPPGATLVGFPAQRAEGFPLPAPEVALEERLASAAGREPQPASEDPFSALGAGHASSPFGDAAAPPTDAPPAATLVGYPATLVPPPRSEEPFAGPSRFAQVAPPPTSPDLDIPAPAAGAKPTREAAPPPPLGFGEIDFGDDAAAPSPPAARPEPILGHAAEPFPFDTARSAAPAEADPFAPTADPFASTADPFAPAGPAIPAPPALEDRAFPAEEPLASSELGRSAPREGPPPLGRGGGLGPLGAQEAEELESLFDDGTSFGAGAGAAAPPSSGPTGFKVRRRSGKTFGPFTEAEVMDMLGKGELLGNEDVSADDGETFGAIGSFPAFAEAMRQLMEPAEAAAPRIAAPKLEPDAAPEAPEPKAPGPEARRARLALASRLGDGVRVVAQKVRARPALSIAAGVVALVLAAGAGAGLTRHGVFFHRLLLARGHGAADKLLEQARGRLAEDGYAGVKGALELANRALRDDPSNRDAKALFVQAASLLARRHGGAADAWGRASGFVPELSEGAAESPLAAKASLAAALLGGGRSADPAAAIVQRHLSKDPRDGDALLLLGDAALARADPAQAAALYGRLNALEPGSARSSHALGLVAARRGDAAAAQKLLGAALAADPRHLASAVELAELALASGDLARARQDAERVIAPEAKQNAGPRERARARAVIGYAAIRQAGEDLEQRIAAAEQELVAATQEDPTDLEVHLGLARFQLERNAPEKVSAALAPVQAANAQEPRLVDLQARALARQGRMLDALTLIDGALANAPGDPRLLLTKGLVTYQGGKRADAERLWADAVSRSPRAWEPHLALGKAKLAAGELDAADKELKLAAELAPGEGAALVGLADLLLARKDLPAAEAGYERALERSPLQAEAHLGLARVALARGDAAAARAALEQTIRLEPRLAAAQAAYGELLWRSRDLGAAKKALQAAVAIDPAAGVVRGQLGAVELEAGEVEAALADLAAASSLEPGSAEIRGWYGRALLAKSEVSAAIEQLRKASEIEPRSGTRQLQLGLALERAGSLAEAEAAYRSAQSLEPSAFEPHEALGGFYANLNRCADALPHFDRAIALAPKELRLRVAVADCKVRLRKHGEAVSIYRSALQADPRLTGLYYKIARAEHESGNRAAALSWYERAAREEPSNPMSHYYLGFAYKDRGERARAVQEFRAYLRGKPDAEDRKDVEREIEDLGGAP